MKHKKLIIGVGSRALVLAILLVVYFMFLSNKTFTVEIDTDGGTSVETKK